MQILGIIGGAFISLGLKLLTESFIKDVVVLALEQIVKKTKTDLDDQLLQFIKKAWDK